MRNVKYVRRVRKKRRREGACRALSTATKMPQTRRPLAAWDKIEDKFRDRVAVNIRRLREAQGMSQSDCAEQAGFDLSTWKRIEAGAKGPQSPTLSALARAVYALGLTSPFEIFRKPPA